MTLGQRTRVPSYAEVVATPTRGSTDSSVDTSKVKVVVRIRPQNQVERNGNARMVVKAMNENVLVFDPKEHSSPEYGYRKRHRRRDIRKRPCKDLKFAFDCVFDQNSANHHVYENSTQQILDGLLDGYNCSVFAYGATGAGKTHTMLGNPHQPGVIYLTMMDLYTRIDAMKDKKICDVAVSYLEVYNEQIHDLLARGSCLPVREDAQNGVVIPGLSLHKPRDADELLNMLQFGNQNRTQHPTDANAESSRSHAVFQVFVRQRDRTANISTAVCVAKMCLVDLAGSERATVTKNSGARFREGANINRSLLALGNVINALADSKYKGHVPYRDSKLTRLLKDSLGGNCQTVMIAAVSPSNLSYEDTYNTLKYADRAKHIQAQLKKNILNVDFHVARYGQIVEELRKEITELKDKLQGYEDGTMVTVQQGVFPTTAVTRLKENMEEIFISRLQVCREYLDCELKSRDLRWKISRKERCLARMSTISDVPQKGTRDKVHRLICTARHRISSFQQTKEVRAVRLQDCNRSLDKLKASMKEHTSAGGDNLSGEILRLTLQNHETSLALTEAQYCIKYMAKVVRCQERDIAGTERLILHLLHLVKQQHVILGERDLLSTDLHKQYQSIQSITEGREVTFADQSLADHDNSFSLAQMLDFKSFPAAQNNCGESDPTSVHSSVTNMSVHSSMTNLSTSSLTVDTPQGLKLNETKSSVATGPHRVPTRNLSPARVQYPSSAQQPNRHPTADTGPLRPARVGLVTSQSVHLDDEVFCPTTDHLPLFCRAGGSYNTSVTNSGGQRAGASSVVNESITRAVGSSCVNSSDSRVSECGQPILVAGGSGGGSQSRELDHDPNMTYTLQNCHTHQRTLTPIAQDRYVHHAQTLSQQGEAQSNMPKSVLCQSDMPQSVPRQSNVSQGVQSEGNVSKCVQNVQSQGSMPPRICSGGNVPLSVCSQGNVPLSVCSEDNVPQTVHNQSKMPPSATSDQPQPGGYGSCASVTVFSTNPETRGGIQRPASKSPLLTLLNIEPLQIDSTSSAILKPSQSSQSSLVTKATSVNSGTVTKGSNCERTGIATEKSHCVRSIRFEDECSPLNKVRSYAEVASSPSYGRVPLRPVSNNTPLAIAMSPALNRNPEDKENTPLRLLKVISPVRVLKGNQLTSQATNNARREKTRQLHQMGLFSVVDRSQENSGEVTKGPTPGYMRMTKAVSGRVPSRHRRGLTQDGDNQGGQGELGSGDGYRSKMVKSQHRRRSKSTTSLNRRGWQI